MGLNIGANSLNDIYLGGNCWDRVYKGNTLLFDAISEINGLLPIIFKSKASVALKNYHIYGTSEGAGVETGNLWDGNITAAWIGLDGVFNYDPNSSSVIIECDPESEYAIKKFSETNRFRVISYASFPSQAMQGTVLYSDDSANEAFVSTPTNAKYLAVYIKSVYSSNEKIAIISGSTAPTSYIPYGYQIPLTITSGAQSQDYPLYIGDSKLGVEEYVDFGEQKIYKMIDGTLTPTDPPISFPEILTYQGENTLSSTETLGEATIRGRIKKITLVTPDLVQGSIDYWPYTIGQKGTRTSVTTRCSTQSYITIPSKSQVYIYADKDDVVFSGCWTDTNLTYQGNIASGFAKELILKNTELSNRYIVLNSIGRMLPTDKEGSPTGTIAPSYFTITFKIMEI